MTIGSAEVEHSYYEYAPIGRRPRFAWPNGARLAISFVVSVEYYELQPGEGAFIPPNVPGGFGRGPFPDLRTYTHREYGQRVGLFRVMDALEQKGIRATAAIDARTALEHPFILERCREKRWEIAGHGKAVTDVISSKMTETDERDYLRSCLAALHAAGAKPTGWHGAEYGESRRTVGLLAELGLQYLLDWPNDDQPFLMRDKGRQILSMPMSVDLDDVIAHWHHKLSMARWKTAVTDAIDQLLEDGRTAPRTLILNLHPWLIGQPYRTSYLTEILDHIGGNRDIWVATAGEIASAYLQSVAEHGAGEGTAPEKNGGTARS